MTNNIGLGNKTSGQLIGQKLIVITVLILFSQCGNSGQVIVEVKYSNTIVASQIESLEWAHTLANIAKSGGEAGEIGKKNFDEYVNTQYVQILYLGSKAVVLEEPAGRFIRIKIVGQSDDWWALKSAFRLVDP